MASDIAFPSPVGGVPMTSDFGPSMFFSLLYFSLIPIFVARLSNKHSRAVVSINAMITVIERVIIFSLRAWQSRNPAERISPSLTTYMQVSIALPYISIAHDVVVLLRCMYVNSTKGPADFTDSQDSPIAPSMSSSMHPLSPFHSASLHLSDDILDDPKKRFFYRWFTDVLNLAFLVAIIPGIIGNVHYRGGMDSTSTANEVMITRYISSSIALFLILFVGVLVFRARKLPKVEPIQAVLLLVILACNASSAIFRLMFMYHRTTSLTSLAPGSGNTSLEKATFYIFHMLSDWLAVALLLVPNIRAIYKTGMWGDLRTIDPPPQEQEWARKRKEAKARRSIA
ncbi:uncharacterized protein EDB91DRAFT_1056420 [Suillus paluster]|uniref:uncharacterized protein n=1 Tax=Suillus paluster TaxID=48578 RepID=UPI001B86C382|nr:uncharacterized protein EDB91DRAFT_1056420 [Suillus paluster]KAG1735109.1 hypothetical protein EDB91DRAFT_1056420 [Suillus paluster]